MSINFNILNTIQTSESNHLLNILVLNTDMSINLNELGELNNYGNIFIVVSTPLESSQLIGRLNAYKNIKVVLEQRIPIRSYDLVISNYPTSLLNLILSNLTVKYLYLINKPEGFELQNYYEFAQNSFRLKGVTTTSQNNINNEQSNMNVVNEDTDMGEENVDYDIFIKELSITPIKYDEYRINYLKPAVPGKVSVVMIISALNNTFAEVIRKLKAQEYPLIEFIIIDNGAGFRNNVKPNIRYGSKMEIDFCEYHAKELCSGEYMFILHEDSELFDINECIEQGKYETR